MENSFIQMAASTGHAVAFTIGSIFKYIVDCVHCRLRTLSIAIASVLHQWLVLLSVSGLST